MTLDEMQKKIEAATRLAGEFLELQEGDIDVLVNVAKQMGYQTDVNLEQNCVLGWTEDTPTYEFDWAIWLNKENPIETRENVDSTVVERLLAAGFHYGGQIHKSDLSDEEEFPETETETFGDWNIQVYPISAVGHSATGHYWIGEEESSATMQKLVVGD